MTPKKLKVATAFSGGFGSIEFALKYENIPHEVIFACEWLEPQRKSYILNHGEPTSNFYKDIRDMDGTKYRGEIDLYHLSPPCQEYSMAGNRGGAATEKGGLMFEAIKSINDVQPKAFTIENVKGLLSSNNGEDWSNILRDINSIEGYVISWGVMNARDQGTPQNRERVFIVGIRGKCNIMPFPKVLKLDKCLVDVFEEEVEDKYYLSDKMISSFVKKDENTSFKFNPQTRDSLYSPCLTARYYKMGIGDPYIKELSQVGNIDTKGHNSIWGRVYDPQGIAPTQNAKGGGAGAKTGLFDTSMGIRRLVPRECARIQGDFDDKFKFGDASDTKLYEFIGNAMDISTTRNLIKQILEHCEDIEWNEPKNIEYERDTKTQNTLF